MRNHALGVSVIAISCSISAQDTQPGPTVAQEKIEFSADQITYNRKENIVTALGRVHLERDGYILDAGQIIYNESTGEIVASGAVELVTPNGDKMYAPRISLKDDLKRAFVEDIRLLMTDGAQMRALSAQRDEIIGETSLERAVYSPCEICAGETDKSPLWQIKAVKVVHNKEKRRLYYTDAVLEIFGVPVLWTPKFSHPDPTVDKASGILPLSIKTTRNLGFYLGVPYHWVINDSQDLTITPIVTTQEGLALDAEYRQHVGFGQYKISGSITRGNRTLDTIAPSPTTIAVSPDGIFTSTDFAAEVFPFPVRKDIRGHIFTDGQFNHSKKWRSTYQINWASDDTYLRRYDISEADTLMSEYKLEGFFGRSYVSARTMAFQGLRIEDISGKTAFALPLIDAEWIPKTKPLGGTLSLKANALALFRTSGQDMQRFVVSAGWQRLWITPGGFVFDADALVRTDIYRLQDSNLSDDIDFTGTLEGTSGSEWRQLARLTGTVSWPLVKYGPNGSAHTIEPLLEVTVSPDKGILESIVNEDSRAFELNALNLFSPDRSSGYDVWEDASRVTYGLRWRYEGQDLTTDVMFGQTWRINGDYAVMAIGIGLESNFSDFVGRTNINYKGWLDFEHRYRLNEADFIVARNDMILTLGDQNHSLKVGYLRLNRRIIFANREDREEIRASGFYKISANWKLEGSLTRRLKGAVFDTFEEPAGNVEYTIGATYENECITLGITVRKNYTEDRDIQPGTSILFRLRLTNLG